MIQLRNIMLIIIFLPLVTSKIISISGNTTPLRAIMFKTFLKDKIINTHANLLITDDMKYEYFNYLEDLLFFKTTFNQLEYFLNRLENKPQSYVIIGRDVNKFNESLGVITNSEQFIGGAKYVLITTKKEDISKLAQLLWNMRLPKSYIIIEDELGTAIKIYVPNIEDCGSRVRAKKVGTLFDKFFLPKIPEWNCKLTFQACPLYVVWSLMPPFVNGLNISFEGIFIEFVKVFSYISKRNIIYRPYDPIYLEEISEAYIFQTLENDFAEEYAHLFVGPVDIHTSSVVDVTPQLSDNSLMILVPKPVIIYWKIILSPTMINTTLIGFILMIGAAIILNFLASFTADKQMFSSVAKTYLMCFGLTLNFPVLLVYPRSLSLRVILATLFLSSVCFAIYIQGSLVSSLSGIIYGPSIENIDELLDSNIPIKTLSGISLIFQQGKNKQEQKAFGRIKILEGIEYPLEAGDIAIQEKTFATVVDSGFLTMRPNVLKSFSVFELFNIKQALGMPKNAFFTEQFNDWFSRVIEIGVIPKFRNMYEFFYALKFYVEEEKQEFTVTFRTIEPGLIILAIGYTISLIVFALEHLVLKFDFFWLTCKYV